MTAELVRRDDSAAMVEKVLVGGDLSKLTSAERLDYIQKVCESLGLNPLTRPFEYLTLKGKLVLYARKDATEQLRSIRGISIGKPDIQYVEDMVVITVEARDRTGRTDHDMGALVIGNLKGEDRANAILKCLTKAKRRATLSICGLGMLDETEIESIPDARVVPFDTETTDQPAPRILTFHEPAEEAEIARLRAEVEKYRASAPAHLARAEKKHGPAAGWDLDTLRNAAQWLGTQSQLAEQAGPAVQQPPVDDIGEVLDPHGTHIINRAIGEAHALVDDIKTNAQKGRPHSGDYDRMRTLLLIIQGGDPWAQDASPDTIPPAELLPYLRARLAGYEIEGAVEGV